MKIILLSIFPLLGISVLSFSQTKVAIIGGGIAGVSTANYIQEFDPHAKIVLFEKENKLGGNAQTVEVKTIQGEKCLIDVGPQYFTKGPWDDYIQFIDETIGYESIVTESMAGTLLIQKKGNKIPTIVTPLNGKLRGEKLKNLLKLKKFNSLAYDVYKNPEEWRDKTIEFWVESLNFSVDYKKEIIYPFLAASLGTTIEQIKKTSTVEIVSLFAFRKPRASNSFFIVQEGMGGVLQRVGNQLVKKGVEIRTNSPVLSVVKNNDGFTIYSFENGKSISTDVDFVVMAVHADIAGRLLKNEPELKSVSELLGQFPYFEAKIVVHQDTCFINSEKPTFLNIFTDENNQLLFSTMNLSLISQRLNGIYKSWMSEQDLLKVKERGLLLHETTFYHPLITPDFVENNKNLKKITDSYDNFSVVGGWTEGLETQNSAVISAKRALEKYKNYSK